MIIHTLSRTRTRAGERNRQKGGIKIIKAKELKPRVEEETARLHKLLSDNKVPPYRLAMLSETIKSAAWLAVKLEDARETIKNGRIILKYDNGGGQKGSRANPAYKVYIDLHRAHTAAIDKLLAEIPPGVTIPENQETPLSIIMANHQKRKQASEQTELENSVDT